MAGKGPTKTAFKSWLDRFSDDTEFNNTPTDNLIFTSKPDRRPIIFRRPVDNRIFSSPTPDIVEITPEDALTNSEDFVLGLTSLEGIPQEVSRVPEQEKENLKSFWAALIGKPALSEQLLEPLQTLRSDANQLIPQLQDLTDQVRKQLSAQLPKNALSKLEAAVRQINIAPLCPPIDDIFDAIKAESEKRKSLGDVDVIELINSLSDEARNWLGRLLLHLVQNPELEADLRAGLRECRWRYVQHDRGYYLLFGQTAKQIAPRAWIEAS